MGGLSKAVVGRAASAAGDLHGDAKSDRICAESGEELGDWLTEEEWTACYFLGQEAYFRAEAHCTVCGLVTVGMRRLVEAGYRFQKLRTGPSGCLGPARGAVACGTHGRTCREVGSGAFDDVARAREALGWIRAHVPQIDTRWLADLIAVYDRVHGGPFGCSAVSG